MRHLLTQSCSATLLLLLFASSAGAQFTEYTTPGGPDGRPVDRKGELEKEATSARLHLGPVRIAPTIELKDVEYVRNLLGAEGTATPTDFTATVAGGVRLYLPAGTRAMWTAYALPEYVWWQKETDRRRFDGLYGVGFDGFFNRLTVQVAAGSDTQQAILTAELPTLSNVRQEHVAATVELQATAALYPFVSGEIQRETNLATAGDPSTELLDALDHDERVERAGLRWRPAPGWVVGAGAEHSDVTFDDRLPGVLNRSNAGTAPVLEFTRQGGKLFVQLDLAQRSLSATSGSSFAHYDKTTGHATVSYEITHATELFVYANRNLVYSLLPTYSYFDDLRHGVSLHVKLGARAKVSGFGETGSLGYTQAPGVPGPERHDDLVSYGGALSFDVTSGAVLSLVGSSTRFTSDLPGLGRSINTLGINFALAAGRPAGAVGP
jgi:hypothetical protein